MVCGITDSSECLEFLLENISLLDRALIQNIGKDFFLTLWHDNPSFFTHFLSIPESAEIAAGAIEGLGEETLLAGLQRAPELASQVIAQRPELLNSKQFWKQNGVVLTQAIAYLKESGELDHRVVTAVIASEAVGLLDETFAVFGHFNILAALVNQLEKSQNEWPPSNLLKWLERAIIDRDSVARILSERVVRRASTLVCISRVTWPDFVPNAIGTDPWIIALSASENDMSDPGNRYLSAYLLSRGLGDQSLSAGSLVSRSFDTVYLAAKSSTIESDAWSLLDSRLPNSILWWEWDYCSRLRNAIVEFFVHRNVPPKDYVQFTQDDELFEEISVKIGSTYGGRNYLRRVKSAVRSGEISTSLFREKAIKRSSR
jgi:hypothetical protein